MEALPASGQGIEEESALVSSPSSYIPTTASMNVERNRGQTGFRASFCKGSAFGVWGLGFWV